MVKNLFHVPKVPERLPSDEYKKPGSAACKTCNNLTAYAAVTCPKCGDPDPHSIQERAVQKLSKATPLTWLLIIILIASALTILVTYVYPILKLWLDTI